MITDHDRSGYFGASDVSYIVGNWQTASFAKWWMVKEGLVSDNFTNDAMLAGTFWEHRILDSLGLPMTYDRQIIIEPLKLRVNLDGESDGKIFEVKTHRADNLFKPPKKYIQQVWVQMYAAETSEAVIVDYGLRDEEYRNYYLPVDENRIGITPVRYNETWVQETFLPRLKYLAECLERGEFPLKVF